MEHTEQTLEQTPVQSTEQSLEKNSDQYHEEVSDKTIQSKENISLRKRESWLESSDDTKVCFKKKESNLCITVSFALVWKNYRD